VESVSNLEVIRRRPPNILFPKAPRFEEKRDIVTEFNLNPNYEAIEKKRPVAIIKNPTEKNLKAKLIQKLAQEYNKKPEAKKIGAESQKLPAAEMAQTMENLQQTIKLDARLPEADSIETVRLKELQKRGDISDLFSDTTEIVGPGKYTPNYSAIEPRRGVAFPKSERFKPARAESEETPINPNYDFVKKTIPAVKIAQETPATEKLLKKKAQEEFLAKLSAELRLAERLDKDAAILPHVPAAIIKDNWQNLSDKEKIFRLLHMLHKKREAERIGPGLYNPKDLYEPTCLVRYARSTSPRIVRPPDRIPSPTRYYPKDDLIYPSPLAFTFFKEGIEKKTKIEDLDMRKPLNIKFDLVKPRIPAAHIVLPETESRKVPDVAELKRGPGYYDIKHDLVERRPDIGVLKMQDITEKNARENQMDLANKDVFDAPLDVNYDQVLPRAPAYKIHSPVKLEGPKHIPESKLHPEKWRYYDVNLDAVKPDVPEAVIAGGLTMEEYRKKEEMFNLFLRQKAKKVKHPEAGQYNVSYKAIEPEPKAPDFDRYPERALEEEKAEDRDIPGDVLILNPQLPKPHLPDIRFDKMQGREEIEKDNEYKEELILEPKRTLVEPRTITLVDMTKQTERKDPYAVKVDENKEELILNPKFEAIEPRVKGIPLLSKITGREDLNPPVEEKEELILNPTDKLIKNDHSHAITMNSKTQRFKSPPKEDINDGRITTEQRIDYNKALDAIKPNKIEIDFNRYDKRDHEKEAAKKKALERALKLQKEKEEKNRQLAAIEEEKEGAFQKYQKDTDLKTTTNTQEKTRPITGKDKKKIQDNVNTNVGKSTDLSPWEDNTQQQGDFGDI